MAGYYVNPTTGNDSNDGLSAVSAWATLTKARDFSNANIGTVETLYLDTSDDPIYMDADNVSFSDPDITIISANDGYADIRYWELFDGDDAVLYDDYYGSSGHPNVWMFVTRRYACIWEFMGERGDNLKWLDHLISFGASSTSHDNATNLSTLNDNAWSWWTGSDGSDYVTLFNCNGSPAGRQFAIPYRPGQNVDGNCFQLLGGTAERLCIGGFSGCDSNGTGQPGTVLYATSGATVSGNVIYGGASHLGLSGAGASVTWLNNIYREGPRWMGTGGYTPQVWYSETESFPPTHTGETCAFIFSVRGQVLGSNFASGASIGANASLGGWMLGHGAGITSDPIIHVDCLIGGSVSMPVDATNCSFGATANSGEFQSCTFTQCITNHSGNQSPVEISDSLIQLNLGGANSSHFPRARCALTIQSSTMLCQDWMASIGSTRPVLDASQGVLDLTVQDSIIDLTSAAGNRALLTYSMNLDDTDVYSAARNIYILDAVDQPIHGSLTSGGASSNRTLAQMQALGYEANSIAVTSDSAIGLNSSTGRLSSNSVAPRYALARSNAPDRSGTTFVTRNTIGAYEAMSIERWSLQDNAADTLIQPSGGGSLGSELVTNPGFTGDASGWTLHANIAYSSNNIATTSGVPNTASVVVQTPGTLVAGHRYLVETVIDGLTAGRIRAMLGTTGAAAADVYSSRFQYQMTAAGTFRGLVDFASGGTQQILIRSDNATAFEGSLTSVSVKEAAGYAHLLGGDNTSSLSNSGGPGGNFLRCLLLDGATDFIRLSGSGMLVPFATDFTAAIWFKSAAVGNEALFGKVDNTTDGLYASSTTAITLRINSNNYAFTVPAMSNDTWYYVAVTRSGTTARLYLNGVESSTGATTVASNAWGINGIGSMQTTNSPGSYADALLDNAALSQAAIQLIMEDAYPINTVAPVISGDPTVGQTLTGSSEGTWSDGSAASYQWKHNGANISGATGNTYVVEDDYIGEDITWDVTYANAVGSSTASSNALGPVVAGGTIGWSTPTGRARDMMAPNWMGKT